MTDYEKHTTKGPNILGVWETLDIVVPNKKLFEALFPQSAARDSARRAKLYSRIERGAMETAARGGKLERGRAASMARATLGDMPHSVEPEEAETTALDLETIVAWTRGHEPEGIGTEAQHRLRKLGVRLGTLGLAGEDRQNLPQDRDKLIAMRAGALLGELLEAVGYVVAADEDLNRTPEDLAANPPFPSQIPPADPTA